jgi:hypothetical protein
VEGERAEEAALTRQWYRFNGRCDGERRTPWIGKRTVGREDRVMRSLWLSGLASAALLILAGEALAADVPEVCNSYKPAVTGGPLPAPESDIVVIRWLGNANFEFAHKGRV